MKNAAYTSSSGQVLHLLNHLVNDPVSRLFRDRCAVDFREVRAVSRSLILWRTTTKQSHQHHGADVVAS